MTDPDDATIEAIARWLEACCPHAKAWQLRRMADRLRSGRWADDPPKRSDRSIMLGRLDDKIEARVSPGLLTAAEHREWVARNDRLITAHAAEGRRVEKMIAVIEAHANAASPPAAD